VVRSSDWVSGRLGNRARWPEWYPDHPVAGDTAWVRLGPFGVLAEAPIIDIDAAIVAGWMAEVQGERLRAEIDLGAAVPGEQMTKEQVRTLVLALHDIASVLATADPKLKADVYAELGVSVA
jgi:hypothetical protein